MLIALLFVNFEWAAPLTPLVMKKVDTWQKWLLNYHATFVVTLAAVINI